MPAPADKYPARSAADIVRLVLEHPLAWVVSGGGDAPLATLLPIRPRTDGEGRITHLLGHFARDNPHVAAVRAHPRALVLFLGPQGYVSPSWFADRTQAPTWNYASAAFDVEMELRDDPAFLEHVLRDLVDAMEAGRPNAWKLEDMGERYRRLAPRILAFEATVREVRAAFKLGQDERDDVYADICRGLATHGGSGAGPLLDWMARMNPGRTPG